MKLVVGLGNPGKKYEKTRHNVGFMILDRLKNNLSTYGVNEWQLSKKFNGEICGATVNGEKIILLKPMTFMNHSGQSVQLVANFYKLTPEEIIVAHDDKDLLLGEIKVQINRGHAGHNGVKSIIENIKTQNFHRIRIGIASSNQNKMKKISKFVLQKFSIFERKNLEKAIDSSVVEILKLL